MTHEKEEMNKGPLLFDISFKNCDSRDMIHNKERI